jgi:hypothetical protein
LGGQPRRFATGDSRLTRLLFAAAFQMRKMTSDDKSERQTSRLKG